MLFHIASFYWLFALQKFNLFFKEFDFISHFLQMWLNFFLLAIVRKSANILLSNLLLFGDLLFQFFGHCFFFFDDVFDLSGFLSNVDCLARFFQLLDLVFVHVNPFVSICQLFVQNFEVILGLENTLSLLWTFLFFHTLKFLVHESLYFYELSFQFIVFEFQSFNKLIFRVEVRRWLIN